MPTNNRYQSYPRVMHDLTPRDGTAVFTGASWSVPVVGTVSSTAPSKYLNVMREVDVVNTGRMIPVGRRVLMPGDIWQGGDRYLNLSARGTPIRFGKEVAAEDMAGEPIGSSIRLRDGVIERGIPPEQLGAAIASGLAGRDMRCLTITDAPQVGDRVWDGKGWLVIVESLYATLGVSAYSGPAYGSIFRDPTTRLPPDLMSYQQRQERQAAAFKKVTEPLTVDAWKIASLFPDADITEDVVADPPANPGKRRFRLDD